MNCSTCDKLVKRAFESPSHLDNTIAGLKEIVQKDLETFKSKTVNGKVQRARLKRKENLVPDMKQEQAEQPAAKQVKKEPCAQQQSAEQTAVKSEPAEQIAVKSEPGDQQHRVEELMNKTELMRLHELTAGDRNTDCKKHPVFCHFCGKTFEGKNRAKVWQHVAGVEHRHKWRQRHSYKKEEPTLEQEVLPGSDNIGKCLGLRFLAILGWYFSTKKIKQTCNALKESKST